MGAAQSFFTQGVWIPNPTFTEKNLPDQAGKVFIITGSNTGVGFELASILYGQNAKIYIAARSEPKARDAIARLAQIHPASTGSAHFLSLDLADLSSIKASAEEFLAKESRLDVLWNNAGVMVPGAGSKSKQGIELQYATNVLGPWLFTRCLLGVLKRTAEGKPKGAVRVCWAGSLVVDLNAPKGGAVFDGEGDPVVKGEGGENYEYAVSKTSNYFLGYEFGRRGGSADGVLHLSFNPGNLKSDLQRHMRDKMGAMVMRAVDLILYKAVFGAYTELFAGLGEGVTVERDQGKYVIPWGRVAGVRPDIEKECKVGGNSEKVWDWCERVTRQYA